MNWQEQTDDMQNETQRDYERKEERPMDIPSYFIELVHPAYQDICIQLVKSGVPLPQIGYEFEQDGRVLGQAELAWPKQKICVLTQEQREHQEAIEKLGWLVWDLQVYSSEVDQPKPIDSIDWHKAWKEIVEMKEREAKVKNSWVVSLDGGKYRLEEHHDGSIHVDRIDQESPVVPKLFYLRMIHQRKWDISLYDWKGRPKDTETLGREIIRKLKERGI
ncbi:hypothetical protein [Thermoflavimicrobium dichotomicum]|uniref:Uncharacterized protein n=1 Tax=Thermoflavimicrobium dichotomicum TaxID=46223 RepID=A0A1I3SJ74_9BACL|nr:hypothetical protein [Thermoflavimicrobium dichotomicum]SFJ58715.1 hypothetical protein SAMN05421852_11363 [Thermoflavimicrobium dichotomicum]